MRRCLLALLLFGCAAPEGAAEKRVVAPRADVIVITVDTLRADHVGAWGDQDANTPTMDALAASGARFDQAFAPVPRTTPAMGSFWTGLAPYQHGSREVGIPLRAGTLLSERLADEGWGTVAVSANLMASPRTGFAAGFDRFEMRTNQDAAVVTDTAIELADGVPPEQPLLLWAHYLDPHAPYHAPPEASPPETPRCDHALAIDAAERIVDLDSVASVARGECLAAYDAEIEWADRHVARLLEHLEASGRLRKAFVVFASDHGEAFGERELWYAHGPHVHQSALHVPFAIVGPGVDAGQVFDEPVGLSDVTPTLLELLGFDVPEGLDGVSLAGWVRDGAAPTSAPRFAESAYAMIANFDGSLIAGQLRPRQCLHGPVYSFCWTREEGVAPTLFERAVDPLLRNDVAAEHPEAVERLRAAGRTWLHSQAREHRVYDGRYSLVERPRIDGTFSYALYDISTDPGEARDLAETHPAIRDRLRDTLEAWSTDVPNYRPIEVDAELRRGLEALGYIR